MQLALRNVLIVIAVVSARFVGRIHGMKKKKQSRHQKQAGAGRSNRKKGDDTFGQRRNMNESSKRRASSNKRAMPGQRADGDLNGAPRNPEYTTRAPILQALSEASEPLSAGMIAQALGLPSVAAREIARWMLVLTKEDRVFEQRPGRFALAGFENSHPAELELDPHDADSLVARIDDRLLPVPQGHRAGAEAGDRVIIRVVDGQALVVQIQQRLGRGMVGALEFRGDIRFVPDNRREGQFRVANPLHPVIESYQAGDRVIGRLTADPQGEATVSVERILDDLSPEVFDFTVVRCSHDLPEEFPASVNDEVAQLPEGYPLGDREDLRQQFIFTIDPETAKDFDDAISLERNGAGWRVGVHIADVSHFVRNGTALDDEALKRGTSCYLINRVIPMLPETLSNGRCSLVPHEDRYTLSVFIDLDRQFRVREIRPCESIIHSGHRLTYEEALAIIEGDEVVAEQFGPELVDQLRQCHQFAQGLRAQRVKDGAINLYSVERRFVLDAEGDPIDVQIERGDVAHQLIEEFMLLANRSIAHWLADREQEAVYRVHGEPNEDKLEQFVEQLAIYGIDGIDPFDRAGLQIILDKLRQEPEASRQVLNYLLLRSFSKVVYQVENIGHFALAFSHYVHFTSPIRRYPDLIIHRLVKHHLGLEAYKDVECRLEFLDAFATQCTWLEQRAEAAERDLRARKAARYLITSYW